MKLDPASRIGLFFGEKAVFHPTRWRTLVMICISNPCAADQKRDKHSSQSRFPTLQSSNVDTVSLNVGSISIGTVTVVE